MTAEPRLRRLCDSVAVHRAADQAPGARWRRTCAALSALKPVIIDESDDALDAFLRARAHGLPRRVLEDLQGPVQVADQPARCAQWNREEGRRRAVTS